MLVNDDNNSSVEDINFICQIIASPPPPPPTKRCQSRSEKFIGRFWSRHKDMRRHYYSRLNRPIDDGHRRLSSLHSNDIPLQCLDAQLLLANSNATEHNNDHLVMAVNPSPASSSLDLEWEHECLSQRPANVLQQSSWMVVPEEVEVNVTSRDELSSSSDGSSIRNEEILEKGSIKCQSSVQSFVNSSGRRNGRLGSWSHISTPDSLEWDVNCDDDRPFRSDNDLLDNETIELLHEIEWLMNRALNETGESLRGDVTLVMDGESES